MSAEWPHYKTARDLAGSVFPVSEEVLLQIARKHGIGRKMGRTVILSPEDVKTLYEVLPCHSNLRAAQNHHTGSCAAPSGEFALNKALELTTRKPPKKSARSARPNCSPKASTVVTPPQRSLKPR